MMDAQRGHDAKRRNRRLLRTAVIGTGMVAHIHARALASLPDSKFVAVLGRNRRRVEAFAAAYGVQPYWESEAMLASGVDVACICTPHPTHPAIAVACAEAGVHVLVEKPLAVDLAGADMAIAAARRSGVRLGVISQRRFYPPVMRMKAAIEAGKVGRPALGIATVLGWRDDAYYERDAWRGTLSGEGGGVLVNQAAHQLDLLLWFMGPAREVAGFVANANHPSIEVEDTAVASIRFANGGLGAVIASNAQKPGLNATVHIHGDSGASVGVQTDGGSMFVAGVSTEIEPAVNDLWTVRGEESLLGAWNAQDRIAMGAIDVSSHFHILQIGDFLEAVLDDREPLVGAEDGRRVVELIGAIYSSAASDEIHVRRLPST